MVNREKKSTKKIAGRTVPPPEKSKDKPIDKPEGDAVVLTKIAVMPAPFRTLGERLHAIILRSAPALQPTLWYGMPAYAKDGKVICFFRADKYMTFGLSDKANLDIEPDARDQLRESAWFFDAIDDATEARLSAIVRKATS